MRITKFPEHFHEMPGLLKAISLLALLSPALLVHSVLTGLGDAFPEMALQRYGAAKSAGEVMLVFVCSIPATAGAIMVLDKVRFGFFLVSLGFFTGNGSVLLLSAVRSQDSVWLWLFSLVPLGILLTLYLYLSPGVNQFLNLQASD